MSVSVLYPTAALPPPSKQGYTLKWRPRMLRTDFEAGEARHRRQGAARPVELPVVFDFTLWELGLFQGFYEHEAGEGAVWFGIPLLTYIGIAVCEARFKTDPSAPTRAGDLFQVSVTLEVREIPRLTGADYTALVEEDPDALFAAIAAFETFVETQNWAS